MSSLTKQAIIDCTLNLAEQKPLRKITVNDIVKSCGITRNTFYYYFHDIYDVLDQTLQQQLQLLYDCTPDEYEVVLFDVIEMIVMYKKVWRNLYKTMGQEKLQKYFIDKVHSVFMSYIQSQLGDEKISDSDMYMICSFYEEALFGVLARWVRGDSTIGTPEEMRDFSDRVRVVFNGTVKLMIENVKNNPVV